MARNLLTAGSTRGFTKFDRIVRRSEAGDYAGIRLAALALETEIKLILSRPGSGRVYGDHTASAPGEPPAVDVGEYRASFGHDVVDGVMRVGTGQARGPGLEFGSLKRRLLPRPHMRPAVKLATGQMTGVMSTKLKTDIHKGL